MNIKQAKEELKHTIEAYMKKDEYGRYRIEAVRQRPVLLMGPPGIGKTAIMEQIAKECGIGLVSYTITHHTRQSAIGLPFIEKKEYDGREYSITEYTMSEIIASVYDKMEISGHKEGILFIDEINCVSETLAPTMLQFLQCKMFGNHKVPEGWMIVAAGNPPEYNKSVRDFDIVTLDRVKKINVEEDYTIWKEYAYEKNIHSSILAYLEARKEDFYRIETTVDGKEFVTARGWEDLSEIMYLYEELGYEITEDVVIQYVQHKRIAKDFANYLDLYYKYQNIYKVDEILAGKIQKSALESLQKAQFDEKISMISLLLTRLAADIREALDQDLYTNELFRVLKEVQVENDAAIVLKRQKMKIEQMKEREMLDPESETRARRLCRQLEEYVPIMAQKGFDDVKEAFASQVSLRKELLDECGKELDNAFVFLEEAFGEGQELVWFVSELTANYYTAKYISRFGCEKYFYYNKELLLVEKDFEIQKEIDEVKDLLKFF
ncbi:MAG TPA: AAA family ATPase [Candidatus Fimousia stercorigallinarum]|nr:AAA family ATPase [Candidatus Fimousia stercorigallinarum]